VLIRAISWLTRWLIGALDPTHGQAVEAAEAGAWVSAALATSVDAAVMTAKPATRTILNLDDRITLAMTPPDTRALPARCPCTAGQIEH